MQNPIRAHTASKIRYFSDRLLDAAKARGWRSGENPFRWRGHLDHLLPRRSKVKPVAHHPALPWRLVGAFMARLRRVSSTPAKALEFLILTAARSGEARGMRWGEVAFDTKAWTVPPSRAKAGKTHRVPLSEPALAVLREMAALFGSHPAALVFPSARDSTTMTDATLARALKAAGGDGATVHGFRSTFRDWAGETTAHPREVIEMALAHRLGDAAEQAYARGDLFEKRRRLMSDWAAFLSREMRPGEVIEFRRGETA
jgi:integrase